MISFILINLNGFAQLKVISNGDVGIGHDNPSAKLEVWDDGTSEIRLWAKNSNTARIWAINYIYAYGFGVDGNGMGHIYSNLNNPSSLVSFYQNKVGIRRTPSYTLDVNGTIRGTVITSSDERLKSNIKPLEKNLELLRSLNGFSYNYKNDVESGINSQKEHFGFIAQELEKSLPNLVYEDDEGILSVDYISMIPVLVEAVKELDIEQKENEILKTKLDLVTEELKYLKEDYEELKYKVMTLEMLTNKKLNSDDINSDNPKLFQNNPNPFDKETKISFYLPAEKNNAFIYIYDMQGTQIKSYQLSVTGYSDITLNNIELQPGIYMYSLIVDGQEVDTKRMILTK
ncbi:MAG: tail fiber domain-containing protein [Bacteroidales bacterium]|nr:tail fiber domain-containing protein [Bacteroidales bacterium]